MSVAAHRVADWNRLAAPLRARSGMAERSRGPARGVYAEAMIAFGDRAAAVAPPGQQHRRKAWAEIGDALRFYDAPEVYAAALAVAAELAAGAPPRAPLASWAALAAATKHTAWVRARAYAVGTAADRWHRRGTLPADADVRTDRSGQLTWLRRWEDVRGLRPDEFIERWDAVGKRLAAASHAAALALLNAAHGDVAAAHNLDTPALVDDLESWGDVGRVLRGVIFMAPLLARIETFTTELAARTAPPAPPVRLPAIARAAAAWGTAPAVLSTPDAMAVNA